MIKLDDTIIQADTKEVLQTLRGELYVHGVERFSMMRPNGDNLQTNCPFHKGGQERKPSFGVNGNLDKCHCFTCGWSGSIEQMVSELFGIHDNGEYGKKWLVRRFNSIEIETRTNILPQLLKRNLEEQVAVPQYVTEQELDSYRYTHPYMYKRGLTDEIIEEFDIGYDKEKEAITFPILDEYGRCVFVATRSVHTKFFGLPQGLNKPVYQAYRFMSGKYSEAYIVESFLNCLTCWKYNKPAMALIGTGNKKQYELLRKLPVRSYILAFDPDEAGRHATERFRKNVTNKIIKEIDYKDNTKDINDLQENFLKLNIIFR